MTQLKIPNHIAIIPDGNRRWAKKRKLNPWLGHKYGAKSTENTLKTAIDLNIPNLTYWICSKDNLEKRTKREVYFLLTVFKREFLRLLKSKDLAKNQVRVRFLGEWRDYFPTNLNKILDNLMEKTKDYNKHNLTFLAGYDGRQEMLTAIRKIVPRGTIANNYEEITPELVKNYLWTRDLSPVDLVIRTGGEPHLSAGFMMWDIADAQLYFTDKLWPDFGKDDLIKAMKDYSERERRLGA